MIPEVDMRKFNSCIRARRIIYFAEESILKCSTATHRKAGSMVAFLG